MDSQNRGKQKIGVPGQTAVFLIAVGAVIVGIIGLFTFRGSLVGYLMAHFGAAGLTGVLAYLTALIARRKGYQFWRCFLIALFLPLALGVAAALGVFYIAHIGRSVACGGSVSLGLSILIILGYFLVRSKSAQPS